MSASLGGRFELRERLGRGAFGEVFRVLDHERGAEMALKRLHGIDPRSIARFKYAFRSLAELRHENLAALYELLYDGEHWQITMELVPGTDIATWAGQDAARWRAALPQIARGLRALHDAGHLHRDLSAANVRVTPEGRVVLLDFGLLGRIGDGGELVGSLQGIAPEVLERKPLGPASDWYAVGAILHEVLHGRPPFAGRSAEVIARKLKGERPARREAERADASLTGLAIALLDRDEGVRLAALDRFGLLGAPRAEPSARFVGRHEELDVLRRALAEARDGGRVHVRVRAPSGMGKTALAARFAPDGALFGRCFEHEAVPLAGLDAIVERLAATECRAPLVHDDCEALGVLFPVLRARFPSDGTSYDPAEVFARAGRALGALAASHAGEGPIVMVLDDLQWGDADGARLLSRLVAPRVLLVTLERSGEAEGGFLPVLDEAWPPDRTLTLGPLDAASVGELAPTHEVQALLAATEGKPLLLQDALRGGVARSVPEAMRARIEALRPPERLLLATLAVAARPLSRELALSATERQRADTSFDALTGLRAARLLVLRHTAADVMLELAHPSLGEVGRALDETPRVHAALDDAMEALALDEPEAQGRHALAARRPARARECFVRAAEHAMTTLAFDRAARLWRSVLALEPHDPRAIEAKLGAALSPLGRSAEAAEAFERALRGRPIRAEDPGSIELARRRAEQWLHAGRIERGERALHEALAAVGEPYPSPARALFGIVGRDLWLRLRGTRVGPARRDDSLRADLCFSAGQALSSIDSVRGAHFVMRSLTLALRAGDRRRSARSLAFVASYAASAGPAGEARTRRAIDEVERESRDLDDPYTRGMIAAARCLFAFHLADYRASLAHAIEVEAIFRRVPDASRERVTAHIYRCASFAMLGEWEPMEGARQELLADARARRDRFGSTNGGSGLLNVWWLLRGEPARARREAEEAIAHWVKRGFHVQHFFDVVAQVRIDLYEARPDAALRRIEHARPRLRRALLWRTFFVRVHLNELEARARLMRAAEARDPAEDLRRARAAAAALRRDGGWAEPYADAIDGARRALEGATEPATEALQRAHRGFARLHMAAHTRATERALAALGAVEAPRPSPLIADEVAFDRVLAPVVRRAR